MRNSGITKVVGHRDVHVVTNMGYKLMLKGNLNKTGMSLG